MSESNDKAQLIPPEGDQDDLPPQYEAGDYGVPSNAMGYGVPSAPYAYQPASQPAAGFNQPVAGFNQPAGYVTQHPAGFSQQAGGYTQPAGGYVKQPVVQPPMGNIQQAPPVMQQPAASHTMVTVAAANPQTVIVQQPLTRPPNYFWLSCLVYWFCNWICGGIGIALSSASMSAADDNRMEEARSNGQGALCVDVIGLVFGILTWIMIILYWTVMKSNDSDTDGYYYG